mmetsp:Transcript_58360/g.148281  ORF Transcript_58360/g.148281 Transcript_58360/m.148281 type:complete len:486 (+) Transcript_58360:566-2023(+)
MRELLLHHGTQGSAYIRGLVTAVAACADVGHHENFRTGRSCCGEDQVKFALQLTLRPTACRLTSGRRAKSRVSHGNTYDLADGEYRMHERVTIRLATTEEFNLRADHNAVGRNVRPPSICVLAHARCICPCMLLLLRNYADWEDPRLLFGTHITVVCLHHRYSSRLWGPGDSACLPENPLHLPSPFKSSTLARLLDPNLADVDCVPDHVNLLYLLQRLVQRGLCRQSLLEAMFASSGEQTARPVLCCWVDHCDCLLLRMVCDRVKDVQCSYRTHVFAVPDSIFRKHVRLPVVLNMAIDFVMRDVRLDMNFRCSLLRRDVTRTVLVEEESSHGGVLDVLEIHLVALHLKGTEFASDLRHLCRDLAQLHVLVLVPFTNPSILTGPLHILQPSTLALLHHLVKPPHLYVFARQVRHLHGIVVELCALRARSGSPALPAKFRIIRKDIAALAHGRRRHPAGPPARGSGSGGASGASRPRDRPPACLPGV